MRAVNLLPAPLHRAALRVAHRIRLRWWRWSPGSRIGVRIIARDAHGRVLLIRHSYGSPAWMPPGGGLSRGEHPIAAATRELAEETGCHLAAPVLVEHNTPALHGRGGVTYIVIGAAQGTAHPDGREIVAAQFFAPDALPTDLAPRLAEAIPRWLAIADRSE